MCFGLRRNTKLVSDHDCCIVGLPNVIHVKVLSFIKKVIKVNINNVSCTLAMVMNLNKLQYRTSAEIKSIEAQAK